MLTSPRDHFKCSSNKDLEANVAVEPGTRAPLRYAMTMARDFKKNLFSFLERRSPNSMEDGSEAQGL